MSRRDAGAQRMTEKKPSILDSVSFDSGLKTKPSAVSMASKNDILSALSVGVCQTEHR